MSNYIPNPDHRGEKLSQEAQRLQTIYSSYFNGLILGDANDLGFVSAQLYEDKSYLARRVVSHADDLSDALEFNGGYFQDDEIDEALCDGIRAYEYADTPFDPNIVLFAVTHFNLDRAWLMDTVRPSNWVLKEIVEAKTKAEKQEYQRKGIQAMGALGLIGFFNRRRKL